MGDVAKPLVEQIMYSVRMVKERAPNAVVRDRVLVQQDRFVRMHKTIFLKAVVVRKQLESPVLMDKCQVQFALQHRASLVHWVNRA